MFGNHGLGGLPEEGAHEKSPKCLDGNLGDFGEFCKGLKMLCILNKEFFSSLDSLENISSIFILVSSFDKKFNSSIL